MRCGILLGYMVSESGRKPKLEKIRVINNFKPPKSVKDVQRILDHIEWYGELILDYATIILSITSIQKK